MKYHVVMKNFLSDDLTVILGDVVKVDKSEAAFISFWNKNGNVLGSFNLDYVKGYYIVK
jgi:hypothetical protein